MTDGTKWRRTKVLLAQDLGAHGVVAPVYTCPGTHPVPYTTGTVSFPGVKRSGRGADHPPTYSAEVKERVELYLYSTSGPSWYVIG
jgi:hypothetical protein